MRRAEKCYDLAKSYRTQYSAPHQLLSPLIRFPFSLGHIIHSSKKTSSVFIDAAAFLLDMHLPVEAHIVLKLDSDIYSCTLDNKWCGARACEMSGDLKGAESFIKEALTISKEHQVTWLLLGHLRYSYKPDFELPVPLQSSLWKGAIDAYAKVYTNQHPCFGHPLFFISQALSQLTLLTSIKNPIQSPKQFPVSFKNYP